MLFNNQDEINHRLDGIANRENGDLIISDAEKLRGDILDKLVLNAANNPSPEVKGLSRYVIKSAAPVKSSFLTVPYPIRSTSSN